MCIIALKGETNCGKTRTLKFVIKGLLEKHKCIYISNRQYKLKNVINTEDGLDMYAIVQIDKNGQIYYVGVVTVGDSYGELSYALKCLNKQATKAKVVLNVIVCAVHEKNSSSYCYIRDYARCNKTELIFVNKRSIKFENKKLWDNESQNKLDSYNKKQDESCSIELLAIIDSLL